MKQISAMKIIAVKLAAVIALLAFNGIYAYAAQTSPAQTYRIAMRGHIVNTGENSVTVFWNNPESMAVDPEDAKNGITQFAELPITKDTVIQDSSGGALKLGDLLPGQAVMAAVRFTVQLEKLSDSSDSYYRKDYSIFECSKITLTAPALKRRSEALIDELGKNTMVGTVLTVESDSVGVYIEGGSVYENGTEFMAYGYYSQFTDGNTKYLGSDGRVIAKSDIKPFQRVLLKVKDHNYFDGSYGYGGSRVASLQTLEYGEKTLSPQDIAGFHRVSATVLGKRQNDDGRWEYVVAPDEGSRELKFNSEYIITELDYGFGIEPAFGGLELKAGTHITFDYTALSTTKGRLVECY
jgi:hypothetical protein